MSLRLPVIGLAVLLLGCGTETAIQKCARPRNAAIAEVDAYLATLDAARARMAAREKAIEDRYSTLVLASKTLFAVRDAFSPCPQLRSLAAQAQPSAEELDDLGARFQAGIEAGSTLPTALVSPGIDAETTAVVVRATNALAVAVEPWTTTLVATLRPGRPWSAAQRRYLTSFAASVCETGAVLDPVLEPRFEFVADESARIKKEWKSVTADQASLESFIMYAHSVRTDLAGDDPVPIPIPAKLSSDMAFAPSTRAVGAYNACRK